MKRPKLTIIVPTYNEHGTVIEMLERVKALPVCKEVIVVDNCSTDGTNSIISEITLASFCVMAKALKGIRSKNIYKVFFIFFFVTLTF